MSATTEGPRGTRGDWLGWLERRMNLTELFSFVTHFGFVYTPVDTSRPVREVVREVADRTVEAYTRGPRVLGLLMAIVFALQMVTGILLAFYYQPTPEAAYESTRTIVRDVAFGWFLHQMHAWGSWLLAFLVIARLLRLFWDGLYRAPREVLWMVAVGMTWLVLQMDFTGRLLTWNAHSYWGVVRGTEIVYGLPLVGPVLAFLLGGDSLSGSTLIRFYVLHIIVLPMWFAAGIYLTFATLRRVGLSTGAEPRPGSTTTYREHLRAMITLMLLMFGVMVSLAVLVPFRFAAAADPYVTPAGARPPWYMLAPYALVQGLPLPAWITGLVLVLVAFGILLLPPLANRLPGVDTRGRLRYAGVGVLALWVALTVWGAFMERR
jgi:quinol-cytochrome oxidoreductase complex cytochrome b subunit